MFYSSSNPNKIAQKTILMNNKKKPFSFQNSLFVC